MNLPVVLWRIRAERRIEQNDYLIHSITRWSREDREEGGFVLAATDELDAYKQFNHYIEEGNIYNGYRPHQK